MAGAGYVVICLAFGVAGGIVGRMKGSSFLLWFLISALIPVLGLLTAVFYRWEDRELRRQCPRCGRVVTSVTTTPRHVTAAAPPNAAMTR